MKKIIASLFSLLLILGLVACKNSSENFSAGISSDREKTYSDIETKYTEENAKADANKIFENLNMIDKLGGSAIDYDEADTFTENKGTYCKVTDTNYTSVEQIKNFMEENLTDNLINGRYATILGTEMPCYVERNGSLYVLRAGKGCGFVFTEDATIPSFNENGFIAERQIDNYGGMATLKLKVVIENGKPKIDSLEIAEE